MYRLSLFILVTAFAAFSCGDDTTGANGSATNNTTGGMGAPNNIRVEHDMGSGPCVGCFDEDGECQEGTSNDYCGGGGTTCQACDDGTQCTDEGQCVEPPNCTPETCDGCCTADDVCVAGDQIDACGTGGNQCGTCPEGGSCNAGQCQFGCGPDNCNGCCDAAGECQMGNADAACGLGGGACDDCATAGTVCGGGACVAMGCSQTCAGCCNGDECVDPVSEAACGMAGGACTTCGADQTCTGGVCMSQQSGPGYDIVLLSADLPSSKPFGGGWDTFGGLPDTFAYIYAEDPTTGDYWLEQSSVQWDTLTPQWNETVLTGVSASALGEGLWFEFYDWDDFVDDDMCIIGFSITDIPMVQGRVIETTCEDYDPEVVFRWRVE